jgi:hypothetical protein
MSESSGNTAAKGGPNSNGSYDYGLFQVSLPYIRQPTIIQRVSKVESNSGYVCILDLFGDVLYIASITTRSLLSVLYVYQSKRNANLCTEN